MRKYGGRYKIPPKGPRRLVFVAVSCSSLGAPTGIPAVTWPGGHASEADPFVCVIWQVGAATATFAGERTASAGAVAAASANPPTAIRRREVR